jgi:hypothetical protein
MRGLGQRAESQDSGQRLAGAGGPGEFQAEGAGRIGEPAVVRGSEVQDLGASAEQVQDVLAAGNDAGAAALWSCRPASMLAKNSVS